MILGQAEKSDNYEARDELMVHSAADASSLYHNVSHYNQVYKIIGQGNLVMAYSQVLEKEYENARFDLYRLENQRIVELWANQEVVPPKQEWMNGGKF